MNERKKILWLVSWYPNKYDPFDGDFIQRHAQAAALHHDVHVLFIKPSPKQKFIETDRREVNGVVEQIVYLPEKTTKTGKIRSLLQWLKIYQSAAKEIVLTEKPALIHAHIPWKAGLIAFWIKKRFNIPYLITEHWGIYNHIVDDNIYTKSALVRYLLKRIYKQSLGLLSVSHFLGRSINETLLKKPFQVIPNVVNTDLFYPVDKRPEQFTFLHVSNMVPLKNVEGILTAFAAFVKQIGKNVRLVMIGNRDDKYVAYAKNLGLTSDQVIFRGEVAYAEVAVAMQNAHVLILNSDIENSPCVIGEALCCGLPVIATGVGGIPELVNEKNGLLVEPRDDEGLMKAMSQLLDRYASYNTDEIARDAEKTFGINIVAQQFSACYKNP